jgi:hypothetical protein
MLLFRPRVRQKRFDYTPRYYNPSHDDDIRRRIRIKSRSRRKNPTGIIWIAALLLMALYIYIKM